MCRLSAFFILPTKGFRGENQEKLGVGQPQELIRPTYLGFFVSYFVSPLRVSKMLEGL